MRHRRARSVAELLRAWNEEELTAAGVGAAESADSVTGGDAHDHSGGDGAQIDHGGLAGLDHDDHPQYATNTEFDDHSARHESGGADAIKLDDLAATDDNTDLDASSSKHGLLPKLSNNIIDVLRGNGSWSPAYSPLSGYFKKTDLEYAVTYGNAPWVLTAINTGTIAAVLSSINNPGVIRITSSGTANSGAICMMNTAAFLIGGSESTDIIFRVPTGGSANLTAYLGFHDGVSVTAPTDGCYVDVVGTTLTGRARSNTTETATGTTYTISENVYYRINISVNAACNLVTYTLYLCSSGAVLWTDTVASNIPTAAARVCGHGVCATESGGATKAIFDIDYMNVAINRTLVR